MTDRDGDLVQHYGYYPFGDERYSENGLAFSVSNRYTSQILDEDTGLYYYGARYYDPELGRFIQADPIVPGTQNSQAFNRYSYVLNNPLRFVDPTGNNTAEGLFGQGDPMYNGAMSPWGYTIKPYGVSGPPATGPEPPNVVTVTPGFVGASALNSQASGTGTYSGNVSVGDIGVPGVVDKPLIDLPSWINDNTIDSSYFDSRYYFKAVDIADEIIREDIESEKKEIILRSRYWNLYHNRGFRPWTHDCGPQADELGMYLLDNPPPEESTLFKSGGYTHWGFRVEGRSKTQSRFRQNRELLAPGNQNMLVVVPERIARIQGYREFTINPYRDLFETMFLNHDVDIGTYKDFIREYPYPQFIDD